MKEGCYKLFFTPRNSSVLSPRFRGTLRVERRGANCRISGDLFVQQFKLRFFAIKAARVGQGLSFLGRRMS